MQTKCSQALYEQVANLAQQAAVFADVDQDDLSLRCKAKHVDSDAHYRVTIDPDRQAIWVGLYTPDRWLSESIEAQLMNTGDPIEELLEEELDDQGLEAKFPVEHFRDDQMFYIFRSPVPIPDHVSIDTYPIVKQITQVLLAYEATFRQLGDMAPKDEVW